MRRHRNDLNAEQAHTLGISDADRFGVSDFSFGKWNPFTQHPLLLGHRPLGGEREKLIQLFEGRLSVHLIK